MAGHQIHTDFKNGYRLKYPDDWRPQQLSPICLGFFAPQESPTDMFRENVNVCVGDRAVSLEQYVEAQLAMMQNMPPGAIIFRGQSDLQVAGVPAKRLEFDSQIGPVLINGQLQALPLHVSYICVVKGGKVYEITYTAETRAYQKYLPQVEEMLKSLEIN